MLQERLDLLALDFATKRAAEAEAAIVKMDVRLRSPCHFHALLPDEICPTALKPSMSDAALKKPYLRCCTDALLLFKVLTSDLPMGMTTSSADCSLNFLLQEERRQRETAAKERKTQAKAKVKGKARSEKERLAAEKEAAAAAERAASEQATAAHKAAAEEEK